MMKKRGTLLSESENSDSDLVFVVENPFSVFARNQKRNHYCFIGPAGLAWLVGSGSLGWLGQVRWSWPRLDVELQAEPREPDRQTQGRKPDRKEASISGTEAGAQLEPVLCSVFGGSKPKKYTDFKTAKTALTKNQWPSRLADST
jgi:hypothetical protein